MTKETIAVCAAIVSAVAAVVVVPEVRDWTCTNFGFLCKRDSITAPTVSNTPVVSTLTIPAPSLPVTETPPHPTQPSTSGGTQVAVGLYPQSAPPQTLRSECSAA